MSKISKDEIAAFSKYVLDISGIYLDQSKGYLLESRLNGLMAECGANSYIEFLNQIKRDQTQKLKKSLIDAISTNETYFFRDNVPFDLLRNKIIPDLIDLRRKQNPSGPVPIKIWSAACSTGQEVYSIAITLMEMQQGMGVFENSILGTDISGEAIAKASYGQYNAFEVERGLPPQTRQKYFTQSGNGWRIRDEIRSIARFESINLIKPFPLNYGPFDIVFCRNVAIYFQSHDKLALFRKISNVLALGGTLIVGGSESLTGTAPDFINQQYLKGNYYTLKRDRKVLQHNMPVATNKVERKKTVVQTKSRHKTVYDKIRKKPVIAVNKIPEPVTPQPLVLKKIKQINPAERFEKQSVKKQEKTSLLASIQRQKKHEESLLNTRRKSGNSNSSLLDKIASRVKKK